MSGRRGRVSKLEAKRQTWHAEHLPLSDLPGFLLDVLGIVAEEVGTDTAGRIGGRMVAGKARQVETLQRGRR